MEITGATWNHIIFVWNSSCYKWFILIYTNALNKPSISHFFVASAAGDGFGGAVVAAFIECCVQHVHDKSSKYSRLKQCSTCQTYILHINLYILHIHLYAQRKTADRGKNCDKKIEMFLQRTMCLSFTPLTYNNFYRSTLTVSM